MQFVYISYLMTLNIANMTKCGFPLAEESKEAENVFLTHGWESGYRCAGGEGGFQGFRSHVFLGFSFCFAIRHCLTCPTHRVGLDVATCGVANATEFGPLATNFSLLVASLATQFQVIILFYLVFHFLRSMTE